MEPAPEPPPAIDLLPLDLVDAVDRLAKHDHTAARSQRATNLCFKPPPDPLGDLDPPVPPRPPLPTLVDEADLCKIKQSV